MRSGTIFVPRHILRYGQEYLDTRLKRLKRMKKLGTEVCKICGVVEQGGRWKWGAKPFLAKKTVCPACLQQIENKPSGMLILNGDLYRNHLLDVTALLKHHEIVEKKEHPLSRILDISTQGKVITVRATSQMIVKSMAAMIQRTFGAPTARCDTNDGGVLTIEMSV